MHTKAEEEEAVTMSNSCPIRLSNEYGFVLRVLCRLIISYLLILVLCASYVARNKTPFKYFF